MKKINDLLRFLRIKPKKIRLYELAFTHPSYNLDAGSTHEDYERLEFLGDAVIGLVVAELAYTLHPEENQGFLTRLRSTLVNTKALANYARLFHLSNYVIVGNSFTGDILRSDKILENVFEAFVGALYLDLGFKKAKRFIENVFYEDIQNFTVEAILDYKSKLLEFAAKKYKETLSFRLVRRSGPDHSPHFEVDVVLGGKKVLGKGFGTSKKAAEQEASKNALKKIERKK
ncbi:MAG: ribonuclease III [Bacilli bacterium]|jgi:ribonuclease-3|nr:ribonuclease III [Bacilli bacterium]NLN79881.1 ribonuclease III [Erysipelotrichia bacterium]